VNTIVDRHPDGPITVIWEVAARSPAVYSTLLPDVESNVPPVSMNQLPGPGEIVRVTFSPTPTFVLARVPGFVTTVCDVRLHGGIGGINVRLKTRELAA
jgi:hypothetical protein